MRGHQQLIAMRRSGFVPQSVFIDLDPDRLASWRDWHVMDNRKASVQIEATDRRPDVRWSLGLRCYVQGSDRARVLAVRDACIACGAARVVATVMRQRGRGEFATFEAIESTDTAGVFEWATSTGEEHTRG